MLVFALANALLLNSANAAIPSSDEIGIIQPYTYGSIAPWQSWGTTPEAVGKPDVGGVLTHIQGPGAIEYLVDLEPGVSYTIHACLYVPTGAAVNVGVKSTTVPTDFEEWVPVKGNVTWQFQELTFTPQSSEMKLYVFAPNTTDEVYLDSLYVYRTEDILDPVIGNASFEDPTLSDWSLSYPLANVTIDDRWFNTRDGDQSIFVSGKGGVNQVVDTIPGVTYKLSAFVKSVDGQPVFIGAKPTFEAPDANRAVRQWADFEYAEFIFTASEFQTKIYAYIPNETGSAWFDGFEVSRVWDNQYIVNSDFSNGFANWERSGDIIYSVNDSQASVNLDGSGRIFQYVPVEPNTIYRLSAVMKNNIEGRSISAILEMVYQNRIKRSLIHAYGSEYEEISRLLITPNSDDPILFARVIVVVQYDDGNGDVAYVRLEKVN
ncbi:MAG: hypothetical protein AAFX93_13780 [Verrucomicrobiota bacterium]